jgi:hypothetical protein
MTNVAAKTPGGANSNTNTVDALVTTGAVASGTSPYLQWPNLLAGGQWQVCQWTVEFQTLWFSSIAVYAYFV